MSKKEKASLQRELTARQERSKKREKWLFWGVTLPLTIVAAISVGAIVISDLAKDDAVATHAGASPNVAPGPAPAAWSYDPTTNRHWDPTHNHWHDGPPPASAPAAMPPSQKAPVPTGPVEAWYYDEPNNQHWDPGHNHWHVGPPPPPEEREAAAPSSGPVIIPQPPQSQPD